MTLWYDKPAEKWEAEALPIGNGRIGAMVFGGVGTERIQFNEDSLWTGDENPSGEYDSMGAYQNFGDLYIDLDDGAATRFRVSCPSGHKPFYGNQDAVSAGDGDPDTKWCIEPDAWPVAWQLDVAGDPVALNAYEFTSANDVPDRDPREWVLEGSSDGRTWKVLDRRADQPVFGARAETRRYEFANEEAWGHYRFTFASNHGARHFQLADITFPALAPAGGGDDFADYRRELSLTPGVASVMFTRDGVVHRREMFASHPDDVIAVGWSASQPGAVTGTIRLEGAHGEKTGAGDGETWFSGALPNGLEYEARVRVLARGGSVTAEGGVLRLEGCDEATLVLAAATNYSMDYGAGWRGEAAGARVRRVLDDAVRRGGGQLLARHVPDHGALFGRVSLSWGRTDPDVAKLPTDRRLELYREGGADPELEVMMVQYGRYLLIGSSREPGLPANLQGLWNDRNNPPWHSDYHSNINVQMNYWLAEPANLAECHRPFFNLVEAMLEPSRKATRAAFGEGRGWTARTSHNIFGGHGWQWNIPASAWYMQHVWEHYAFGRDLEYLRTTAYPMMKEVCEYWEDHLKELPDGSLVVPNGWSPEHGPREDGVAHDQQIVWDLFTNTIEASAALGVDADYRAKLSGLRDRLVGPKVGRWGQLMEWMVDRDDPDTRHRHTSHLFAVYPGRQISVARTPEWAEAAAVSLAARGETGDSRRSWTWPWRTALWARLGRPEDARRMVRSLLTYNTLPNLMATHPPMQLDGNFGITAGVCEILLQSHAGELALLPALPSDWPSGHARGLRARGGFTVDMEWEDGRLRRARILATVDGPCRVRAGGPVASITSGGRSIASSSPSPGVLEFAAIAGSEYLLEVN